MCKSMRKHYERYSEEFKLSVIRDYYSSGLSKNGCVRKYGLSGIKLLCYWLKQYAVEEKSLSLSAEGLTDESMSNRNKESYRDEISQLKKRIRELEKALEVSHLETLSRDLLIDRAESYFDIPIRKKSGAR